MGHSRHVVSAEFVPAELQPVRVTERRQGQGKGEEALLLLAQPEGGLPALLDVGIGLRQQPPDGPAVLAGLGFLEKVLREGTVPVFDR